MRGVRVMGLAAAAGLFAGVAAGAVATGASVAAPVEELTVFAAASLTEAFRDIGAAFEQANPGVRVVFNFGGSPQLRQQIEQGARADVFASANQAQMDALKSQGLLWGPDRTFARNRLVVVMPKDNPGKIRSLQDLARPGVKFLTTHRAVPVGAYTRAALEKMSQSPEFGADFASRVAANIVSEEDNVKQIVTKVQLGEVDAGVVYSSDITPAVRKDVVTLT
ncbi:MAG TPA: molybdate ABC transporter substrate-binding protein, partial [Thermodesulfobacteriota bacterium]